GLQGQARERRQASRSRRIRRKSCSKPLAEDAHYFVRRQAWCCQKDWAQSLTFTDHSHIFLTETPANRPHIFSSRVEGNIGSCVQYDTTIELQLEASQSAAARRVTPHMLQLGAAHRVPLPRPGPNSTW
ncbi:unnamed protein product, partial [Ectocarpus sp. 12 AP-2014]